MPAARGLRTALLTRRCALQQVLDTVQEIAERASAVKDLERQLLGLHQIFLDMAVLVEAQGEMLDNIETQARGTAPDVGLRPRVCLTAVTRTRPAGCEGE